MAPHSSTLAWKIPWMEEPGRLQSMGSLRVRHEWVTSFSLSLSCIGEGNGNPLQCSCLENPRDGGAWWLPSVGSHRVGHDWSDLAAAAISFNLIVLHIYCHIYAEIFHIFGGITMKWKLLRKSNFRFFLCWWTEIWLFFVYWYLILWLCLNPLIRVNRFVCYISSV